MTSRPRPAGSAMSRAEPASGRRSAPPFIVDGRKWGVLVAI